MSDLLLALGAVLLWLGMHPFTTYPLSLLALARLRPRPFNRHAPTGSVALCVCAYNEESVIAAKIENMLSLRRSLPSLEVLVYVDGASDRTAEILRAFESDIRLFASPDRQGKTHGMNVLVAATTADLIVFSDANVLFQQNALPELLAPFGDPTIGCVCGKLIYTSQTAGATASTGSLYWRYEEFVKGLESITGSAMGADGSIFAIRRSLHEPPPPDLIDDMFVSFSILCCGYRIVCAPSAIAYEEIVSHSREEFLRKQRISCQAFNVHRFLFPRILKLGLIDIYKYLSHKLLRWIIVYLILSGGVIFLVGLTSNHAVIALMLFLCAILGIAVPLLFARSGPLATLGDMITAFIATGLGVARSYRGERFQTWNPPQSARQMAHVEESMPQRGTP